MKDWRLNHLGDVGRIEAGTSRLRRRGESHLVVDDDVNRSANAKSRQLREIQGLTDNALAGKGRVAVNQDREIRMLHEGQILISTVTRADHQVLLRANDAFDDR